MTTQLLERAIAVSRDLPADRQDEAARILLAYAGAASDEDLAELSPEDGEAALRSREAASRDEFASDAEMRALRAKHGL